MDNDDHVHAWGPLEHSRLAGTVHRKCQVEGCLIILAFDEDEDSCHPDCGPIVERADGMHAHENVDGRCWHDDEDA